MAIVTRRVYPGHIWVVAVAANTAGQINSAKIWSIRNGSQDVLVKSLAAGESYILGPYQNEVNFRIETVGDVTVNHPSTDYGEPGFVHVALSQAEYDAIAVKNPATLYLITG